MYKVGFIDDDRSLFNDYKVRLGRKDIELVFAENCITPIDVADWIITCGVKCMLVDYKLTDRYDFNGTNLVAFINSYIPDLPCIIITNYTDAGIKGNLVVEALIIEREVLDKELGSAEFEGIVERIKQAVDVFDNRIKLRLSEYEALKLKKDVDSINSSEEERLIDLYKILRAYNEVDDLPAELLTTNAAKKMSDILQSLDKLIDKIK